jgi:hypothetical protein
VVKVLRADLHVHTYHSPDCALRPQDIVALCQRRGIDCVAITDHNSIAGALEVQRLAPFLVIVGEEVRTQGGEIIGLFLQEEVPPGLSAQETVVRIKEQRGLVLVPHPFDRLRRSTLRGPLLEALAPQLDALEVFNSRTLLPSHQSLARDFAAKHGLPSTAGSDAHTRWELGRAYVEIPEFQGAGGFLDSLAQGWVVGRASNPLIHFATPWNRWSKRGKGQRQAGGTSPGP